MSAQRRIVVHVIAGLGDGGAQAVLYRVCTHASDWKHIVVSLTDEGRYGPLMRERAVEVHTLDMRRGRVTLKALATLRSILRGADATVVQTWMYHADLLGGLLARSVGVKRVFWNIRHSELHSGKSNRSTIAIAQVCAWLSKTLPTAIVCCATRAADVHVRLGYCSERIKVIANGFDTTYFAPDRKSRELLRSRLELPESLPVFGFVARYHPDKDHETLLSAFSWLVEKGCRAKMLLAGAGLVSTNRALATKIKALHLEEHVQLVGPQTDIPGFMNMLDVHVMSSSSEAFPNVLAEAMACGTPCITTDVGAAAEIIGTTGWVVPPASPEKLGAAMGEAIDQLRDRTSWGQRQALARSRICDLYSIAAMTRAYCSLWDASAERDFA